MFGIFKQMTADPSGGMSFNPDPKKVIVRYLLFNSGDTI